MVVADSSALVEVLVVSAKGEKVRHALRGEQVHAPDLVGFEVLSAIRGKVRRGELSPGDGIAAMDDFYEIEARLDLWPLLEVMAERAIELRDNVSAYDACYVTLATLMPCPLVTADAKLGRAVEDLVDLIVV